MLDPVRRRQQGSDDGHGAGAHVARDRIRPWSMTKPTRRPTISPSALTATSMSAYSSRAWPAVAMFSLRLSTHFTGRPVATAAAATATSSWRTHAFCPNDPPMSSLTTRTECAGRWSRRANVNRTSWGFWVRGVTRQLSAPAVELGDDAPRFHWRVGDAMLAQTRRDNAVGSTKRIVRVTKVALVGPQDVGARVLPDRRQVTGQRLLAGSDRRQRLVIDDDQLGGIVGRARAKSRRPVRWDPRRGGPCRRQAPDTTTGPRNVGATG